MEVRSFRNANAAVLFRRQRFQGVVDLRKIDPTSYSTVPVSKQQDIKDILRSETSQFTFEFCWRKTRFYQRHSLDTIVLLREQWKVTPRKSGFSFESPRGWTWGRRKSGLSLVRRFCFELGLGFSVLINGFDTENVAKERKKWEKGDSSVWLSPLFNVIFFFVFSRSRKSRAKPSSKYKKGSIWRHFSVTKDFVSTAEVI